MKDKIIIILLVLLVAGVARSHYKIKRIEANQAVIELKVKELEEEIVLLNNDINLVEANQEVIVNYIFPEEEEVRVPILEPNPLN
jgi:hypothetical protein